MASSASRHELSDLQKVLLREFFARERGFFLTGGAALVGYYLHHRATDDLDLFTLDPAAFERARYVLPAIAEALALRIDTRVEAPDFRRVALTGEGGSLVVDLVRERVKQVAEQKREVDGILVDSPEEILANKLTALVGRMEERDLVDVLGLERAGVPLEPALTAALEKDGGCTPATLAWLLSGITIPQDASLPGGVAPAELRAYVDDLVVRLRRLAAPGR